MMRLAMIQRFLPSRSRGGVGYFTHGLANALTGRGHRVTVWSYDPAPYGANYEVKTLAAGKRARQYHLDSLVFPFQLAEEDFSGFDVIHAQGDDQWISKKAPPVVRTLHGSALQEAWHNGLLRGSAKLFLMHLYFYFFEFWCTLKDERVAAVSNDTKRFYSRIHEVIPNGVDFDFFSRLAEPKSEHPVILFVGQMATRKRGRLLVKIFQDQVRPLLPEAELWLVSPEEIRGPGILWFGSVSEKELVRLYKKAWVFCLPSSYEGFGRPYLEAMAAGTPVVATPNPGAREILEEGRYGLICPEKKVGAALYKLLMDKGLREDYQNRSLSRAAGYAWDKIAQAYEKLYQEAIQSRHALSV